MNRTLMGLDKTFDDDKSDDNATTATRSSDGDTTLFRLCHLRGSIELLILRIPPLPTIRVSLNFHPEKKSHLRRMISRAMVQEAAQGIPSVYAREMECLSAKELLILALYLLCFRKVLVTGKITDFQKINVNQRITTLEQLNPTPRPTTSPYLEGRWSLEWFGSNTPGSLAARLIFTLHLAHR
ncbi:hypothetical protein Bca101_060123 [Brassica carinata]